MLTLHLKGRFAGGGGNSIVDIQREESQQAKRRAAQEAAAEGERAAAAANAPSHGSSSWGKAVLRPAQPSGEHAWALLDVTFNPLSDFFLMLKFNVWFPKKPSRVSASFLLEE